MEQRDISNNLRDVNQWTRILYMVMFAIAYYVANVLLWVIVIVQIVFSLVTGSPNSNLTKLGSSLSRYIFQVVKFVTYNTEEKPFPIQDWPAPEIFEEDSEGQVDEEDAVSSELSTGVDDDVDSDEMTEDSGEGSKN